jgi:hypothetical protein
MTPFQGAGAGQAVEDALVLSHLLSHVKSASDVAKALQAYDQVRRPRKQRIAETSLEVGRVLTGFNGFGKLEVQQPNNTNNDNNNNNKKKSVVVVEGREEEGDENDEPLSSRELDMDRIRNMLLDRMNWIWNHDLEAQNDTCVRLFREAL